MGRGDRAAVAHLRGAYRRGHLCRVLARRHPRALGELRQDAQIMGRGDRAAVAHLRGACRLGHLCRVLARRHPRALGERATARSNYGTQRPGSWCALRARVAATAAFSPDGKRVLSGGNFYGTRRPGSSCARSKVASRSRPTAPACSRGARTHAQIMGRGDRAALAHVRGHAGQSRSVAFSPDGTRVLSGSLDRTLKLWDARPGSSCARSRGMSDAGLNSVAFSPDGTRAVSGGLRWNTIRIWNVATGESARHALRLGKWRVAGHYPGGLLRRLREGRRPDGPRRARP